ncbi:MAG TPA: SlyX family protein [Verrucomicrobiota bacterium]|nr:SlyX family protein [Verrucomicrobiota bacterium]HNT15482.1 SlyX family protein [Verrucomicrobiota bacterium]
MPPSTHQRFERLETLVAHLERQMDALNEVVIEQGRLLHHLQKELHRTSTAMQSLEWERIKAHNPKPPHYS